MGDFLSTKQNTQATTNQQVGVSGSGVGQSGTVSGVQAAGNSTGIQSVSAGGYQGSGGTVNITTSDVEALHFASDIGIASLAANQNVALQSVNASQQVAINALQALNHGQDVSAQLAGSAVDRAQQIALLATPQSPAAYAETVGAQQAGLSKPLIYAAVGVGVLVLVLLFRKQ